MNHVLGVVDRAEHPVPVRRELRAMAVDLFGEGGGCCHRPTLAIGTDDQPVPQPAARFTSSAIRASSSTVSVVRAKAVGHMVPSSSCAGSLKPKVE